MLRRLVLPARGRGTATALPPGSLEALRSLDVGGALIGVHPDGREERFVVAEVTAIDGPDADVRDGGIGDLPGDRDHVALDARAGVLRLVLCGGPYEPDRAAYRDTVVVTLLPAA